MDHTNYYRVICFLLMNYHDFYGDFWLASRDCDRHEIQTPIGSCFRVVQSELNEQKKMHMKRNANLLQEYNAE